MGESVQSQIAPDQLALWPAVLDEASASRYYQLLQQQLHWQQPELTVYGKNHPIPRRQVWMGDQDAHYGYAGRDFQPMPWHPLLQDWAAQLSVFLRQPFNSVLANWYRQGQDKMGWHSDDEPELGPIIAMISLGACRELAFRRRQGQARFTVSLPAGSLLVMGPGLQQQWQHSLPARQGITTGRISLTFRQIMPLPRS